MAKSQILKRSFKRITYHERVIIENRYCIDRWTISAISKELKRPVSAISREIGTNSRIGRGRYSADLKQKEVEIRRLKQGRKSKFENEK
jgi:IS30 family transposase